MHGSGDSCGNDCDKQETIELLRKRVKELEEQNLNAQELATAYDSQFREMTKEIDQSYEKIKQLETEGLKIQAERDAIIQFSRDVIKDLKGGTYDQDTETNPVRETQDTSPSV